MNQGIIASHGEFVIPLNNDVCLHKDFVAECVRRTQSDPSIGAIGGRVYSWIGDELTDKLRHREGEHYIMKKRFQSDAGNVVAGEKWTFAPTGSFPFFRRKMLDDLLESTGHYYDEAFETGWEDGDLYFRMHLRGWKCLFLPAACGWHVGSGSVGGKDTFLSKNLDYQTRILRNRHFTIVKNLPAAMLLWLLPYLLVTELAMPPYFLVRSPKSLGAWLLAWMKLVRAFPEVLRKRSLIQKSRKVDPLYLKQYFVRF
jgi:GT2 family glycosyltransferase